MNILLYKHCIYNNLIGHLEDDLCNISAKGRFGGEICEIGRFVSTTWETFLKCEIDPKRGSLPPKLGGLTGML